MIEMPDDLDDAIALFDEKSAALAAAVKLVEEEQAGGRTGVSAFSRAAMMRRALQDYAERLQARIHDELGKL